MLSKNEVKFIISLQGKKRREEHKLYVIEGDKIVREFLMSGVPVRFLAGKPEFLDSLTPDLKRNVEEIRSASYEDLKKISTLKTPHNAVAVVIMPEIPEDFSDLTKNLAAALDCVQDPGNMGTIIRSAAWFGINCIYCSEDCVDNYNPKVIQASMGAILHVKVIYTNLKKLLTASAGSDIRIFGAVMDGYPVYSYNLDNHGIILFGNESKGISDELIPLITDRIMIPRQTGTNAGIDSLNVSMAASVIFSEFARRRPR